MKLIVILVTVIMALSAPLQADAWYRCINSNTYNDTVYTINMYYKFASDPGANFEALSGDYKGLGASFEHYANALNDNTLIDTNKNNFEMKKDILMSSGDSIGDVIMRIGASNTEGFEIVVHDETIDLDGSGATYEVTSCTIETGEVILAVQATIEDTVEAATSVNFAKVGVGEADGDPDEYGLFSGASINLKSDKIPDWAVFTDSYTFAITACQTGGGASSDNLNTGEVRFRAVYLRLNSLDN